MATLALAPFGFVAIFSVFHEYDDEGYFLLTLKNYLNGGADYTHLYGPLYYQVMAATFWVFRMDVSTDNGRLVTLGVWLLASLIGGITVLTLTSSLRLGVTGLLITFYALSALTNEPMHASGLIALLLVSLTAVAAIWSRYPRTAALAIGALVAAMTLVKINVGAYAALSVVLAFAAGLTGRWRRVVLPAAGLVLVAATFLVTRDLFGLEWVRDLALLVALSVVGVVVAALAGEAVIVRRADWIKLVAGGVALTVVSLGIAAAGGLRLSNLVDFVTAALQFPGLFTFAIPVGIYGVIWAALCAALAGILAWRRSRPQVSPTVPAALRIAAGAFILIAPLFLPLPFFLLALPLAWLAVVRPAGDQESPANPTARVLLASLAVMASLQAYPVAGTQRWIAAVLVVPVGAVIVNDGVRQLQQWAASREHRSVRMAAAWVTPAVLILSIEVVILFGYVSAPAYISGQSPGVRGTELMRLPPAQASAFHSLAATVESNCVSLITLPRMASLNIWTGVPGNSRLDANAFWMYRLDSSQQQSIVSQIQDQSGVCVVFSQQVFNFWAQGRPVPRRPLVEYIDTAFQSLGTFGIYELRIRK